jgi:hypothetical protein
MQGIFPQNDWSPEQPNSGDDLWRYVDFTQLMSLLENESLWFSSVSMFFDPFEGALPRAVLAELANRLHAGIDEPEKIVARLNKALKHTTYASCWHQRNRETAAMWQLYQSRGKEVAIRTTVQKFQEALPNGLDLTEGCVNYEDYETANDFIVSRVSPFFHKRPSFQHEREYRAIISESEVVEGARVDERYGEKINESTPPGRAVSVDIEDLVQEIVVSPVAAGWVKSLVEQVTATYELEDVRVRSSTISDQPY